MACFICGQDRNMMYACGQCGNNICYICNKVNMDKYICYVCYPENFEVLSPKTPQINKRFDHNNEFDKKSKKK